MIENWERAAAKKAKEAGLQLGADHWRVLRLARQHFARRVGELDARTLTGKMSDFPPGNRNWAYLAGLFGDRPMATIRALAFPEHFSAPPSSGDSRAA